jgi:hypothetical protein
MERRDFLKGTAVLGAGLVVGEMANVDPAWADRRIRWGALCLPRNGQTDQIQAVKALEAKVDRRFATTHYRLSWERPLVNDFTKWSVRSGHTPIISWFTRQASGGMVSWRSVADGDHDGWITTQARSLRKAGWSGYFCFHKEPEDEGNAKDWKDAHDRVYQIFRNVGVRFRFVPTLMASTFGGLAGGAGAWLPPRYDLIGVDGYNRVNSVNGWRSFDRIFTPAHKFARHKRKGLYIIEYGSTEGKPGHKATWLQNARATMKRWNNVVGCSYNHEHTDCVYWVDTSVSSLRAFKRMGHDPAF